MVGWYTFDENELLNNVEILMKLNIMKKEVLMLVG